MTRTKAKRMWFHGVKTVRLEVKRTDTLTTVDTSQLFGVADAMSVGAAVRAAMYQRAFKLFRPPWVEFQIKFQIKI